MKNILSCLGIATVILCAGLYAFQVTATNRQPKTTPPIAAPSLQPNQTATPTPISTNQPKPTPSPLAIAPTSGTQLYYQRRASLKAGKIYTHPKTHPIEPPETEKLSKPTHQQWKNLLAQEAQAVVKGQGDNRLAILVGDSLSLWFPPDYLPEGYLWLNQSISGENSTQILNRLSIFAHTEPDIIYVMAGTNDLRQGVSDEQILNTIRQILHRLRQTHPQAQIIVQSILPTRVSIQSSDRIHHLNEQIAAIAVQQQANYLNLYALFLGRDNQLRPQLTTDGIHLTPLAYQIWQQELYYTAILSHPK